MKRIFSLVLALMFSMSILAAPAAAAEAEDPVYIDLLDYGFPDEANSNTQSFRSGSVLNFTYNLPSRYTVQYIDVLFTYYKNDTPTVKWYTGTTLKGDLAVVNVSGNVFRAFGSVNAFYANSLRLEFTAGYANTNYITIESFKVGRDTYSQVEIEGYCEIVAADYNNTIHYVPTDESNKRTFAGTNNFQQAGYNLFIYSNEWRRFDYIDFMLYTEVDSVSSVSCTLGTLSVPYQISFLSNDSMSVGTYCYTIRMDLTGVDRSVNDYPMITVSGNVSTGTTNLISVLGCVGIVNINAVDSDVFWFDRMVDSLKDISQQIFSGFSSMASGFTDIVGINQDIFDHITWLGTDVIPFINSGLSILHNDLGSIDDNMGIHLETVWVEISSSIASMSESVTTSIEAMSSSVISKLDDVRTKIVTSINNMKTSINSKLDSVIAAINGDSTSGDAFKEELEDQESDLQQMQQVLDSVSKPALEDVNVSVDLYVQPSTLASVAAPMQVFLSGQLFGPMVIMSILMATVSFILFGKR